MKIQKNIRLEKEMIERIKEIKSANMTETVFIENAISHYLEFIKNREVPSTKNTTEEIVNAVMDAFNKKYSNKFNMMDFNVQNCLNLINTAVVASGLESTIDIFDTRSKAFKDSSLIVKNRVSKRKQLKDHSIYK